MKKIHDKINELDKKMNPSTGLLLKKIFKSITLILLLLVLPVISLTIGALFVGGTTFTMTTVLVGFFPWFISVLFFGLLWFYFSKWTISGEE